MSVSVKSPSNWSLEVLSRGKKPMKNRQIGCKLFFLATLFLVNIFLITSLPSLSISAPNPDDILPGIRLQENIFETDANTDHGENEEGGRREEKLFFPFDFGRRKVYCLVIDPGHGGDDYGVVCSESSILEKELTLDLAKRVQNLISENTAHRVLLTRTGDYALSLIERTTFANHHKADLFISLHFNAHFDASLEEMHVYITTYSNEEIRRFSKDKMNWDASQRIYLADSRDLALRIEKAALNSLGFESIKLLEMPLFVLKGAHMPALLIENAFLSNPQSIEKVNTEEYRQALAFILYRGIISYIQYKEKNNVWKN